MIVFCNREPRIAGAETRASVMPTRVKEKSPL